MKNITLITLLILKLNLGAQTNYPAGALDSTFQPQFNIASNHVRAMAMQPDGKLICGGDLSVSGISVRLARLNTNGSIDTTFTLGSGISDVKTIALQLDGKIIVGGNFQNINGNSWYQYVARFNSNGTVDNTFKNSTFLGTSINQDVKTILIQPNGKIIVGGNFGIVRINPNASIDTSFHFSLPFGQVYSIALQPDGKIIISGGGGIKRVNSNGSLDTTFNNLTSPAGSISTITLQGDKKILIGGSFASYDGTNSRGLIRLDSSGFVDNLFNSGVGIAPVTTGAPCNVLSIALQQDNKIIIGGQFTYYNNSIASQSITRLNADGSIDNTFNIPSNSLCCWGGSYTSAIIRTINIQPDHRILIGGSFQVNGQYQYARSVARLWDGGIYTNIGIKEIFEPIHLNIYPIPTENELTIEYLNYKINQKSMLKILNSLGQIIYETNITQKRFQITVKDLKDKGIYFVRLIDENENTLEIKKIILQ